MTFAGVNYLAILIAAVAAWLAGAGWYMCFGKTWMAALGTTPEAMEKNQALIDLLNRIAGEKNATPAQIALAWLLAQKPWIVPIPGTTKLHRLEENIAAVSVELSAGDLREIEDSASRITVQGARYSEGAQRMVDR